MKALIGLISLAVIGAIALFFVSASTTVVTMNPVKVVGQTTPVTVQIANPHGVRHIFAYIEQGAARYPLTDLQTPAHRIFFRRHQPVQNLTDRKSVV